MTAARAGGLELYNSGGRRCRRSLAALARLRPSQYASCGGRSRRLTARKRAGRRRGTPPTEAAPPVGLPLATLAGQPQHASLRSAAPCGACPLASLAGRLGGSPLFGPVTVRGAPLNTLSSWGICKITSLGRPGRRSPGEARGALELPPAHVFSRRIPQTALAVSTPLRPPSELQLRLEQKRSRLLSSA